MTDTVNWVLFKAIVKVPQVNLLSTECDSWLGVHTVKIIRYGTGTVYFIRFQYSKGIDTGYFLYFVDVFEILSRALVLGKVWWGWTSTM